ncbi:hypothetical protein [Streptomyces sp. B5E4]|uniref:hypothetical protein n=1 Tax=Streptomyces sp. B5E4 TaxID=3153568 RepID=UPI00325E8F89
MLFPDPDKSQAVLIGVSRHTYLDYLPTVDNNLKALSSVLMSASSWSLPENSHCRVVPDPENVDEVVCTVRHAARAASDALVVSVPGVYFFTRPEGDPTPGLDYSTGDKPTESHEVCRPPQSGGGCAAAGWRWSIPASEEIRTTLRLDGAGTDRALAGGLRVKADCDVTVEWDVIAGKRRVVNGTLVSQDLQHLADSLPREVENIEVTARRTDTATCEARLYWDDAGLTP